ncbi:LysR family transcriptional regulator [Streptomyces sp. NPDC058221]|uniref:LysR family transcriptional regulator n=1 Tax=Streptomyces sp. NPDC058221 TaxID=3346388 RepID=UPI0036E52423
MERYEIETFLALAEELHFARTAQRLHISPGRVSQTVKALERRIGAALFERTSRHVALTPAGRQLRDGLLPAYQQIQQVVADVTAACADISGVLRAGFTAPWSGKLLAQAAETFSSRYPHCSVELLGATYHNAITALRRKDVYLVIAEPPVEECDVVVGPVLFSERRALVVPAAHPLAARESASLEDLAVLPLVTAADVSRAWREAYFPCRTPADAPIQHGAMATASRSSHSDQAMTA